MSDTPTKRIHAVLSSFALAAFALASASAFAQGSPAGTSGPALSRFELYGGYGYFHPYGSDIGGTSYPVINSGGLFSTSAYFTHHLGLQVEGNYFPAAYNDHDCVYSAQAGPILRAQKGRFVPFVHALGGAAKVGGPAQQPCNVWGWGATGGIGIDYILPVFHNHFAIRPVQADFSYSQINNGPLAAGGATGGLGQIYALRLSAGLSLRLGDLKPAGGTDTTLTCSADPASVFPGDPVTLSSNVLNLRSAKSAQYLWTSTGGRVSGTDATASLDTSGLAPGSYMVSARLVQGSRQRQVASCTSSFTVRAFEPPTVSCSANRSAINSGVPVTVTAAGVSPQNRPLSYSFSASNGQVTSNPPPQQNTAVLSTAGSTPGTITVTCNVTDDKGQAASASASVVIATPPPPAPEPTSVTNLCALSFERDARRPNRVDNEAKACLDDIALTLNRDPSSKLVLIGNHGARESNRDAAERTLNAADYLTREKGIDRTRLDLRIGDEPTRSVTTALLPLGATFAFGSTAAFDPGAIHRSGQPYAVPRTQHPTRHRTTRKPASTPAPPQ